MYTTATKSRNKTKNVAIVWARFPLKSNDKLDNGLHLNSIDRDLNTSCLKSVINPVLKPSNACTASVMIERSEEEHPIRRIQEDHHHLCDISIKTDKGKHAQKQAATWKEVTVSLTAGAVAGATAKTVIAPLDRTKILFQTSDMHFSPRKALNLISKVYHNEGIIALWRGNSATMARIIPYAAIQYASHEQYKSLLNPTKAPSLQPIPRFLAGSLAGVTASTLTYPLDCVRARMAVTNRESHKSMSSIIRITFRQEGLVSFYRGYLPTVLGVIPYGGISFFIFETFKKRHRELTGKSHPTPSYNMAFGAVAGLVGQSASYPLDVVRRRMQTAGLTKYTYDTIVNTAREIYHEGGVVRGLYKGLSMNWVKGPIAVGVSFTTYELARRFLQQRVLHDDVG
ncbi:mitochondrial coenzyme A transporter SLC25A42-like isoform X1 [Patiria miniata]|uniref:Mitochondrial coenzyme A transporter SLC25A42 n=2 Tax=Patiria miniata TaxID=46514 RepID=A0A913Z4C1_PATMI|nr:mitochondrial coenzyme A transporter SLC25A42-like isoform X1 [Patiria miniata]